MARREFSSMLGSIDTSTKAKADAAAPTEPATARTSEKAPAQEPRKPPAKKAPAKKSAPTAGAAETAGGVGYVNLERKEARIHEQQAADLNALARRLNKQRNGEGHRITENTLIRLAIDLLLQRSDQIAGTTETELGQSLGTTG